MSFTPRLKLKIVLVQMNLWILVVSSLKKSHTKKYAT